jgi:cobalt-zinc-cadmium efflux system membrane fusion protein
MTKKQKLTIAAIAAVTALLAALILLSGASKSAPADAHAESGHDHAAEKTTKDDHKEDGHKEAKGDHDEHKDKDEKGHDEKDHDEKGHDEKGHNDDSKIAFSEQQLKTAGIVLDTAAPGRIRTSLQLPGEIRFNQDRTAHVVPKVNGVVESVSANLGQNVKKGQVLAVVSSSTVSEQRSELLNAQQRLTLAQSTHAREKTLWQEKISAEQDYLQAGQALKEAEIAVRNAQQKLAAIGAGAGASGLNRYEIRAPFDGIVVEKHLALGEAVKEDANVFTISDLSSVWAEMTVAARDMNAVRVGESVTVNATAFASSASGKIAYVGALLGEQTRTAKAHVVLPNPGNAWRPGLFVNVDVLAQETDVALAVAADAVQSVEQKQVVFVRIADGFRKQEVTLGRTDGKRVEILKGLSAGDVYAAAGSFVIKAELGKGSAEHAH